ncbi:MAG: PspC domain-containing protein [Flavobacteriales bacterium]|nr:PspC domain-containing protein [Flavobacteriales bacterium]
MKKTVTANIAGTVFHIEEDAYDQLQRYLAGIRANFSGSTGAKEIMADIEARIAELFSERLQGRNVVTAADVEHVMSVMGQPEDFAEPAGESASAPPPPFAAPRSGSYKRFFRDPDDKWLGGVLGGLAAYIGMDPLWLRVAMIVLVWASVGVLIPMYILLWILVPKAESAADRLQMRGEAVTVENIKRVVEEGAEKMKAGGERVASEAKEFGERMKDPRRKGHVAEVFSKLVGVALIVFAFSLLLGLITGLIGGTFSLWHATWTTEEMGLLDLGELLFTSKDIALWTGIGIFMLLAIPIIGLFLGGFRLLLNTRTPKWLGWSLCILWFMALIPAIRGGMDVANEFKRSNSVLTEIELAQPTERILYLDALDPIEGNENWSVSYDDGDVDVDLDGLHLENGIISGAWARLDVERSADSLFHLKVLREAHGSTAKAALDRARGINFNYKQEGDVLRVSPVLNYAATDKFRAQDIHFTLEMPLGGSIFLRPGSKAVIYDIDNVTNTWDRDMIGHTWTMTERGLMDTNAPVKDKDDKDKEKDVPGAIDTVKAHAPIAAVVFTGPAKRKAPARAQSAGLVLPDLLTLLRPRLQ